MRLQSVLRTSLRRLLRKAYWAAFRKGLISAYVIGPSHIDSKAVMATEVIQRKLDDVQVSIIVFLRRGTAERFLRENFRGGEQRVFRVEGSQWRAFLDSLGDAREWYRLELI